MNANNRIEEIFHEVVGQAVAERSAMLDRLCGTDRSLRREVEALLRADADPASVPSPRLTSAEALNPETWTAPAAPISEKPGESIGRYKLLERIGEGGFGEVWVAEQKEPVRRRVALKIIKAGMDTREVLARFEAERQVLALLDHPNIAKVFDAGATEAGRPYFVMEHVAGMPINEYCDSAKLRIRERLGLFTQICQAVQHAHTKGIIHRDLKPSNILVTLNDGRAVPKVIDFGIAKVTIDRLTDRTLYTQMGRLMGTPEYMAPEQAGTGGLDVDTRADIYSLGVILYQLLTGTLPFDAKMLRGAGFDGMVKLIRELEPPKPSTRLSTLATEKVNRQEGETPEEIGKRHGVAFADLRRELRGDLDWIVMKCLDKERSRRYETANSLALEIGRHLAGEPVLAAPPSAAYRLRKFIRRHRTAVMASCGIVAALVAGLLGTTFALLQANTARRAEVEQREIADRERSAAIVARDEAQKAQQAEADARRSAEEEAANARAVTEFLRTMLASVDPTAHAPGEFATTQSSELGGGSMLEAYYSTPVARSHEVTVFELLRRTIPQIGPSTKNRPRVEAAIRETVGQSLHGLGLHNEAVTQLQKAIELYKQEYGLEHPMTLRACVQFGEETSLWSHNRTGEIIGPILPLLDRVLGPEDPDTLRCKLYFYTATADWPDRSPEALRPLRKLVSDFERVLGPANPHTVRARGYLAGVLAQADANQEAETLARQTLQSALQDLGPDHVATLAARRSFGSVLVAVGRMEEALAVHQESLNEHLRVLGPRHIKTQNAEKSVSLILQRLRRWPELLALRSKFVNVEQEIVSTDDFTLFEEDEVHWANLALAGQFDEACKLLQNAIARMVALHDELRGRTRGGLDRVAFNLFKPYMRPVAECLLDQVIALYGKTRAELPPDDPRFIDVVFLTSAVYAAAGRHGDARTVAYEAFQEIDRRHGLGGERVQWMFNRFLGVTALSEVTQDSIDLTVSVLERAERELAGNAKVLGKYFSDSAEAFNRANQQLDRLVEWAERGHRLAVEGFGEESREATDAMAIVALLLHRAGRAAEAVELQARVIDRLQRIHFAAWHPVAVSRATYGLMLAAAGRPTEAKQALLAGCKNFSKRVSPTIWSYQLWPWWEEWFDTLADLLDAEGDHEQARHWRGLVLREKL